VRSAAGADVVRALTERGVAVRALVRRDPGPLPPGVTAVRGDAPARDRAEGAMEDVA
jgi:hypothetical protein